MLDTSWLLTFLVALVTWFVTKQWLKIRSLPPGPLPLPLVGNLLAFRSKSLNGAMNEYQEKFGKIFTVWMGTVPYVVVSDYRLIREALIEKKTDFAGRPELPTFSQFVQNRISVTMSQYSKEWEIIRKMAHSAIRKYATSERLPPLVDELTEETVDNMLKQEKPFNTLNYMYHLIFNIVSSTIVGERFQEDDPTYLKFRNSVEAFQKYLTEGMIAHYVPILKPFYRRDESSISQLIVHMLTFINTRMKQHVHTYQQGDIRDMIDSLLAAREEMVAEFGEENTPHLNDGNIFQLILDIFGAATDTTSNTLRWLILHASMHPQMQEKIIQEIRDNIGDRIPTQEDRKRCPYTSAFIAETMRIKAIAPYGLPHEAVRDSQIGSEKIPKGTSILFRYGEVLTDELMWKEPDKFLPERFLDAEGRLGDAHRQGHFLPFGTGRRSCVGEKLATEEIFLVTAGIFRRCRITLDTPPEDLRSGSVFFAMPKHYTVKASRLDH